MNQRRQVLADLDNVVAVAAEDGGELRDAVIGNFVFYQIGEDDLRVTREALAAYMEHYDIAPVYLPPPIDSRKVIRRLLVSMPRGKEKRKRIRAGGKGPEHIYEYHFTIEDKEGGAIEAVLKRERRRSRAERDTGLAEWDPTTVLTVVWTPDDPDVIGYDIIPKWAEEYPYEELVAELESEFEDLRTHYTGGALRDLVKSVLNDRMGVPARPKGGVWVIPRDAVELVKHVRDMVQVIAAQRFAAPRSVGDDEEEVELDITPGGAEFHMVPIVDGEEGRLFIRGKVEAKVVAELETALNTLQKLAEAQVAPNSRDLAGATRVRREALALRDHYRDVIGTHLTRVDEGLELFDRMFEQAVSAGDAAAASAS